MSFIQLDSLEETFPAVFFSQSNLPNGNDVNEFSLIFNFERYLASEIIENGILSIVLHSILIECTDVNCVGPPNGNELKLFRAKEIVFK